MAMGEHGMGEMTEMEMPLPDNTLPMMTGQGPFGSVAMGGMFTVVKVRREQKRVITAIPAGTQAWEWTGSLPQPATSDSAGGQSMPSERAHGAGNLKARKPSGHEGHR